MAEINYGQLSEPPLVLWLIWQNTETRNRYHVGNLIYEKGQYLFYYEKKNRRSLSEAEKDGYEPHLAFPDTEKVYRSSALFPAFERRLPDRRRVRFKEILKSLDLDETADDFELLAATGGRLATDPYEFVMPITRNENEFIFSFYIAGWRYNQGEEMLDQLTRGMSVQLKLEPENEKDPKAVALYDSVLGQKLGYVPAFYSGFIFDLLQSGSSCRADITEINRNAYPQKKVKVSIRGGVQGKEPGFISEYTMSVEEATETYNALRKDA